MQLMWRSLASYFYSRPPLAIFLASLLTLSMTTLSLGIYCHYNTSLLNVDVLNWHKLMTEMSKLKYCLHSNSTMDINSTSEYCATQGNVQIQTGIGSYVMEANNPSSTISWVGNISLSLLGLGYISQENITVLVQKERLSTEACIRVESQTAGFVENLRNESIGQSTCLDTGHVTHMWTAHSAKHLPHTWCSKPGQHVFDMKFGDTEGLETYLTQEDRNLMYQHLLITSLFLVLVCVGVITWAWVSITRDQTRDMTLLPSTDSDHEDI